MAKKKNYNKPKAQKKQLPAVRGNKRQQKKREKQIALQLAAKKGITEKDLKKGNVSRETFNKIVTQEKKKEQAKAARTSA